MPHYRFGDISMQTIRYERIPSQGTDGQVAVITFDEAKTTTSTGSGSSSNSGSGYTGGFGSGTMPQQGSGSYSLG